MERGCRDCPSGFGVGTERSVRLNNDRVRVALLDQDIPTQRTESHTVDIIERNYYTVTLPHNALALVT
jgi:hypothetical protein